MGAERIVAGHFLNADTNVGTMVGYALQIGEDIRKDKPVFNGAFILLQAQDMVELDLVVQLVNHLLQRFYAGSFVKISAAEGIKRYIGDFLNGAGDDPEFVFGFRRKADLLFLNLLGGLQKMHGRICARTHR